MPMYRLTVIGESRELYDVEADTGADARAMFDSGQITAAPDYTEVTSAEVTGVEVINP